MKNVKLSAILVLFSSVIFSSCSPDHDFAYISTTKEIISQGKWQVDYYYAGQDKTSQYNSYQFIFNGNGTVDGTNGVVTFTGTWAMISDVNYNDVLQININSQQPHLNELNEQWKVTDKTISVVAMQDGNSTQLRFKKV